MRGETAAGLEDLELRCRKGEMRAENQSEIATGRWGIEFWMGTRETCAEERVWGIFEGIGEMGVGWKSVGTE